MYKVVNHINKKIKKAKLLWRYSFWKQPPPPGLKKNREEVRIIQTCGPLRRELVMQVLRKLQTGFSCYYRKVLPVPSGECCQGEIPETTCRQGCLRGPTRRSQEQSPSTASSLAISLQHPLLTRVQQKDSMQSISEVQSPTLPPRAA